jgi:hydroxymethylbilane synthase
MPKSTHSLTLGTRGSALARRQTDHVIQLLQAAWLGLDCRTRILTTSGDRVIDKPLPDAAAGGKGLFTEELENALRSGEIDLAVHSLKDLPIDDASSLILGAICSRQDARDVLISRDHWTFATLPQGARVGTSSLRRAAQLLAARPDLRLLPLRGNVDTRVRKAMQGGDVAGGYDAIVLAAAGVLRLSLEANIAEYLPFDVMLPAPGQGALAVQGRADDATIRALLAPLDDGATRASVTAERAFLQGLGGGCSTPVAAYASSQWTDARHHVVLSGLVASSEGRRVIRVSGQGADPAALGMELAQQALAQGAGELLR